MGRAAPHGLRRGLGSVAPGGAGRGRRGGRGRCRGHNAVNPGGVGAKPPRESRSPLALLVAMLCFATGEAQAPLRMVRCGASRSSRCQAERGNEGMGTAGGVMTRSVGVGRPDPPSRADIAASAESAAGASGREDRRGASASLSMTEGRAAGEEDSRSAVGTRQWEGGGMSNDEVRAGPVTPTTEHRAPNAEHLLPTSTHPVIRPSSRSAGGGSAGASPSPSAQSAESADTE